MTKKMQAFLSAVKAEYGDIETITRSQVLELSAKYPDISKFPPKWLKANTVAKAEYALDTTQIDVSVKSPVPVTTPEISGNSIKGEVIDTSEEVDTIISFIPDTDKTYVPWGNHKDLESIVKSRYFYPTFITGLSGNGKTFMVEQICAKLKRDLVRVNITIETDEDDLLGGFRLVDGETVFHKGPVIDAMERGAVLLLDEVDLASNKILCLQPVLEGKGVYLKKINKWIKPADGFTVIATANTKGKGSESGAFIGTNILNEAFLERFAITIEQEYPPISTEKKILSKNFKTFDIKDDDYVQNLVNWADIIRKTYYDGGVDEIISTRRLVHIAKAYSIFQDRAKAIDLCIQRFDDETKESFRDLYSKVDAEVDSAAVGVEPENTRRSDDDIDITPF
jgi:MoxR-like ATPase